MKSLLCAARAAVMALGMLAGAANASVVIGGTRVVFPAQDGEVTLRLTNQGSRPALVEAWIDSGNPQSTPDKSDAPFLITPPLFRMEPHRDQSLRIIATQPHVPADRESLFWLNVLEVPPKPTGAEAAGKNLLQFAIRSRLKLFYRPAQLAGDPQKSAALLTWKALPANPGMAIEVHNPSPFYITLASVSLDVGGKHVSADTGMVAPFGTLKLAISQLTRAPAAGTALSYSVINDYGAANTYKGSIAP
ncbi:MAG TPA: fimbria/pilus periplasmic chaperone [Rhodanobacter sp.]|nr:fimbria/pilus periplasmic chaperone [Rhodanobacter sp.]